MVLFMSLSEFMECFWADEAPFFVPGLLFGQEDKVVNYTGWYEPTLEDTTIFGDDVISVRKVEKSVEDGLYTGLWSTITTVQHIALLESTPTKVSIMIKETQSGFTYADTYEEWYKWEINGAIEDSHMVVLRKQSAIKWLDKPWITWRYINSWAVKSLKQDAERLKRFLQLS